MNVPGYESPICEYGESPETVGHYLLECPRWTQARSETLGNLVERGLEVILGTKTASQKAVEFVLRTKRLEQFQAVSPQG